MKTERELTFEEAAKPLIDWLREHAYPHATVIVTPVRAELLSTEILFETSEESKN